MIVELVGGPFDGATFIGSSADGFEKMILEGCNVFTIGAKDDPDDEYDYIPESVCGCPVITMKGTERLLRLHHVRTTNRG